MRGISFRGILLFSLLFTYILIPSLYLGLRIKRRTNAYWLASLVCIFIVSLAIFLYRFGTKERQTALKELSLTQFYPNASLVNRMGVMDIYSPRTTNFSLILEKQDTMLNELDTCGEPEGFFYIEDGRRKGENLLVPRWGMRTYEYSDWRRENSPFKAELFIEGNEIKGWLENKSPGTMRNAIIVFGQRGYSLGDIGREEKKEISLDRERFTSLIGMEKGAIFFPLEEWLRETPVGQMLSGSKGGSLTNCFLLWEGESSPSVGEVHPQPRRIYRQSLYAQHILLPVLKLPEKVPFIWTYYSPMGPTDEEGALFSPHYMFPPSFSFSDSYVFRFATTIEGVKFSKLFIDIQLDSKSPTDLSFVLRGKKTSAAESIKGKSPGHITYTIDKPDDFLVGGRYLLASLELEHFSSELVEIKGVTVYGVPKGG